MNRPLRQSTASQKFYFVMIDNSDFKTRKTGLTIANTDIKLIFEGGTTQTSKNSGGATEIGSTGIYYCTFDATDSATLGGLRIDISVSGALPYFRDTAVLNTALWDALYASSGGAIPNIATGSAGGILTGGTSTAQINPSTGAVPVQSGTATGQINLSAGNVGVQSGTNANQISLSGGAVLIQNGTNAGQVSLSGGFVLVQNGTNSGQISTSSGQILVQSGTNSGQQLFTAGIGSADMVAISGDLAAADNLETMLDGTGGQALTLKQFFVSNTGGDAVVFQASGASNRGFVVSSQSSDAFVCASSSTNQADLKLTNDQIYVGTNRVRLTNIANLDAAISSRLSSGSYTAPDNASGASAASSAASAATSAASAATSSASAATSSAAAATSAAAAATDTANLIAMTSGSGTNRAYSVAALANAPIDGTGSNVTSLINMTTGTGTNRAFRSVALANAPTGGGGGGGTTGDGEFPVDHNGGSGTDGADVTIYIPATAGSGNASAADVMQITDNASQPVQQAIITAFLASSYDAGIRTPLASTKTGSDGRWNAPLNLSSGTYYLLVDRPSDFFQAYLVKLVIP